MRLSIRIVAFVTLLSLQAVRGWVTRTPPPPSSMMMINKVFRQQSSSGITTSLQSTTEENKNEVSTEAAAEKQQEELVYDYEVPEDAVINIKPNAMKRLRELREQQPSKELVLRMGVRSGGCSGLSYVMDFAKADDIQDDDMVDEYAEENIRCVVDAKSMLYLYGLELDYSDKLIGGGFQFFNPNAEESCGCGSSFGV